MRTETAIDYLAVSVGLSTLNCISCKRAMIPGEVFANGYGDGPSQCHSCKHICNERLTAELLDGEEGEI